MVGHIMISSKPLKTAIVVIDGVNAVEQDELRKWVLYSLSCASIAYCLRKIIFS